MINEVLSSKTMTKKQVLTLVDKLVVYEDSGIDIYLKGNLHELSKNYFKVNETTMNKTKMYLYEYISQHPEKFTKDACTLYVKSKGVKTNYKIISRIINQELGDMVQLREMMHGYRLIAPIEDVAKVLLNNIVVGAREWLHSNNVEYSERMEFINNVIGAKERVRSNSVKQYEAIEDIISKYRRLPATFELLTKISDWTQGLQPKNHRF